MPRTTHRFPLNLADPCTRGWGGAHLSPIYFPCWIVGSILLLLFLTFNSLIGPWFAAWLPLWLPLWCGYSFFLYLRHQAYFDPQCAPKPRVVCDPRGITLHDTFGRIRHQWRWGELADVRYQRGMQHGLLLEPHHGNPVCYRSGYLDYPDYADIVATAQRYLCGRMPPLQPVIVPSGLDHCWYELRDGYGYNIMYWLLLFCLSCIPKVLADALDLPTTWAGLPPTILLSGLNLILIAGSLTLCAFIISFIMREYRVACAATPRISHTVDRNGLHIHHRNGRILSLPWQDIIDITMTEYGSDQGDYRGLKLHDRLGYCRHINHAPHIYYKDDLAETLALFLSIRDGKKPLPLHSPVLTAPAALSERFLFWPTTLLACLFISASIQKELGVQTWLSTHYGDIFFLFLAQGILNVAVALLCALIHGSIRNK